MDKHLMQKLGRGEILGREIDFYGENWNNVYFLATDVATWIEHSNVSKMIDDCELDETETTKQFIEITYSYGNEFRTRKQEALFLTEDGLYEVLMQSRKPIAKQLKKEVKTYLKEMRLTGGAVIVGHEEEFIYKMFPSFSDEVKRAMINDLIRKNREKQEEIERERKARQQAEDTLEELVNSIVTFDTFNRVVVATVNAISKATNIDVSMVYNKLYDYIRKAHGMNLQQRATNTRQKADKERFEKTGKHYADSTLKTKYSVLSTVASHEYKLVLQVVEALAVENDVDILAIIKLQLQ